MSAITAIDPCLYEAASIDGANVLNAGFEVQYLLGNGLTKSVSDTIDIYVLTWGISQNDFSLGTAAGIFKSLVSIAIIFVANYFAKKTGEERLF